MGRFTVGRAPEMVRAEGFEPPRLASLEPKSSASTNSATPAEGFGLSPRGAAYNTPFALHTIEMAPLRKAARPVPVASPGDI